jgi:cytochrome P450 / NADPH-cytochrome P450 reductase
MVSIVQKFDLEMVDPSYTLEFRQSLTIKPKDFFIRPSLRTDGPTLVSAPSAPLKPAGEVESPNRVQRRMGTSHSCMYSLRAIPALQKPLHKSCVGCICPRYASRALNALYAILTASLGFSGNIATLDSVIGKVPVGGPVISITASFEGTQYLPLSF